MKLFLILLIVSAANSAAAIEYPIEPKALKAIADSIVWDLDSEGINSSSASSDRFGWSLEHGNFNGDAWDDLAIGIPRRDISAFFEVTNAGVVVILFGSSSGLTSDNSQFVTQGFVAEGIEDGDLFGSSLVSGDFNGDGIDDLVVGSIGESVIYDFDDPLLPTRSGAGAINIFYGSSDGLTNLLEPILITQGTNADANITVSENDQFGFELAAGDLNNDSIDDLVVGTPFEDVFGISDSGMVTIFFGDDQGISAANKMEITQATQGIENALGSGDRFGHSLAVGHFDSDSFLDLAIGVPGETISGEDNAGAVQVIQGGVDGLTTIDTLWSQQGGILGVPESGDLFGFSIGVGDLNGDSFDDLIVGVPQEDRPIGDDTGIVNVIYSDNEGLTVAGNIFFELGADGFNGVSDEFDFFGFDVSVGNLNGDVYADLVIGSPLNAERGSVLLVHGSALGITSEGNEIKTVEDDNGAIGFASIIANFGAGQEVAIGNFSATSAGNVLQAGVVEVVQLDNPFIMTAGHRGTFFEPTTAGQGVLIDINADATFLFLAWFTYANESVAKSIGGQDQRWLTAQGEVTGNPLTLDVLSFSGGVFDNSDPTTSSTVGSLTIEYINCNSLTVDYQLVDLDSPDPFVDGRLDLVRLISTDSCIES